MFSQQITHSTYCLWPWPVKSFSKCKGTKSPLVLPLHFTRLGHSTDTTIPSESNPINKHQKVNEVKKLGSSGSTYSRTVSLPLPPPKGRRLRPRNRSSLRRMGRSSVVCPLKTNQNKETSLRQVSYLRILKVLFP